jgi:glycosyl-4,4'-diaponeurosporenoate acyltransferase
MKAWGWALNVLGWPMIHVTVGALMLRSPEIFFARDSWLTRERHCEQGGRLYRNLFFIQRWKRLLPDGAPWLGGTSKKRLKSRSPEYLRALVVETRRAEWAHWCMLLCIPWFFIWNPPWACAVMVFYGLFANLPCILAQRANRLQLNRMANRYSVVSKCPRQMR